jgi:hypothetical protein
MSPRLALLAAVLAALTAAPSPAPAPATNQVAELAGRAPGEPQRCVGVRPGALFATADSDPHVLLYDDGKTIWVSPLQASCEFGPGESIIPDETASYYCRGDFVRQGSRIELSPFGKRCVLGNFTPYRTAK